MPSWCQLNIAEADLQGAIRIPVHQVTRTPVDNADLVARKPPLPRVLPDGCQQGLRIEPVIGTSIGGNRNTSCRNASCRDARRGLLC